MLFTGGVPRAVNAFVIGPVYVCNTHRVALVCHDTAIGRASLDNCFITISIRLPTIMMHCCGTTFLILQFIFTRDAIAYFAAVSFRNFNVDHDYFATTRVAVCT